MGELSGGHDLVVVKPFQDHVTSVGELAEGVHRIAGPHAAPAP
jgi:hypothetical protein